MSLWEKLHVPSPENMSRVVYHNLTIAAIPTFYSNKLIAAGTFAYSQYHDTDTAEALYTKAQKVDPNNTRAYNALAVIYSGIGGKCKEIVTNLTTSLSLN